MPQLCRPAFRIDRHPDFGVATAEGKHLFPFRTEKLSPPAPMVLPGKPGGRVGRRPLFSSEAPLERAGLFVVLPSRLGSGIGPDGTLRPTNVVPGGTADIQVDLAVGLGCSGAQRLSRDWEAVAVLAQALHVVDVGLARLWSRLSLPEVS